MWAITAIGDWQKAIMKSDDGELVVTKLMSDKQGSRANTESDTQETWDTRWKKLLHWFLTKWHIISMNFELNLVSKILKQKEN
jgi:hypothetical protein